MRLIFTIYNNISGFNTVVPIIVCPSQCEGMAESSAKERVSP